MGTCTDICTFEPTPDLAPTMTCGAHDKASRLLYINILAGLSGGVAHCSSKILAAAVLPAALSAMKQKTLSGPPCSMPLLHMQAVNSASLMWPSQFSAKRKHEPLGVPAHTFISGRWLESVHPSLLSTAPAKSAFCQYNPRSASTLLCASCSSLSRRGLYSGPVYPSPGTA